MSTSRSAEPASLKVLVIDDSALVREAMSRILGQDGRMKVATAANPLLAMQKMRSEQPDVIVLDLEMPQMHGLVFLEKLMSESPLPVVICSEYAPRGSEQALRALDLGAVEIVAKPRLNVQGFFADSAVLITDTVRAAAKARIRAPRPARNAAPRVAALPRLSPMPAADPTQRTALPRPGLALERTDYLVAIGASTGGTEALHSLLETMPADAPAIAVVQHMPEGFTAAFARRLAGLCAMEVKEAQSGDELCRGRAVIAQGNRHLLVHRRDGRFFAEVADGPLVSRHRPSVDVLFRSVAVAAGARAIGVLMTGMGDDGAEGLLELRRTGAHTIAQDEQSSVVFGMPKAAIDRGAAIEVTSLSSLPASVLRAARR
jgi:two-component system chemotaxis response regulator CheB